MQAAKNEGAAQALVWSLMPSDPLLSAQGSLTQPESLGHTFLPKSVFSRTCPGTAHKVPFREKHGHKTVLLEEQGTKYEFGMQTLWPSWASGSSSLRNPTNSQPLPRTLPLYESQCHPCLPQQSQLDLPCHRTPRTTLGCQGKKVPGPDTGSPE